MQYLDLLQSLSLALLQRVQEIPLPILLLLGLTTILTTFIFIYIAVSVLAPTPRPPHPSEKQYITTSPDGSITPPRPLPCWHDEWLAHRKEADDNGGTAPGAHTGTIDEAEVQMSVVIPAYNEEERLEIMLEEAIGFLDAEFGRKPRDSKETANTARQRSTPGKANGESGNGPLTGIGGYEIIIVNDGSKDKTVDVALAFSRKHKLHDILRVVTLKHNRGKGGAVTHGFRHVRGVYAVFADADGASKFSDLAKLIVGCEEVTDASGRAIAVGSRAHLVGSEAVVKRSALRNALMHSFHLLLRLLTPPATSRIRDTQCGFKLFSRAALPHIIPYMHAEGWIFDVEMLMLAESAPPGIISANGNGSAKGDVKLTNNGKRGINVAEIPIGWHEIGGSKLNVMWDSLGMAWGLAILRASWMLGVYKRR
ncbi:dolichyl-phosphate beta-glucosyltransferase-like protein [Xylogone sp. PMI_703]|nr:dolichyl-phosphate beta-glucosyltransferase-like protein [Xylogone sp. PMI_703]